jgi:hypothetical protein
MSSGLEREDIPGILISPKIRKERARKKEGSLRIWSHSRKKRGKDFISVFSFKANFNFPE